MAGVKRHKNVLSVKCVMCRILWLFLFSFFFSFCQHFYLNTYIRDYSYLFNNIKLIHFNESNRALLVTSIKGWDFISLFYFWAFSHFHFHEMVIIFLLLILSHLEWIIRLYILSVKFIDILYFKKNLSVNFTLWISHIRFLLWCEFYVKRMN